MTEFWDHIYLPSGVRNRRVEMSGIHEFLRREHGGLSTPARQLPLLREYMNELPETASTFKLTNIDGLTSGVFEDVHVEFAKSWPLHKSYDQDGLYVNPHAAHAHRFSDIVVECECGAQFSYNYEHSHEPQDEMYEHSDSCLPQYRFRARAELHERRMKNINRLGHMGWKGSQMSSRLGTRKESIGAFARKYGLSLRDLYDEYRQRAARTYVKLVVEDGVPRREVGRAYNHDFQTLHRWAKEYDSVEYEYEQNNL